MPSFPTTNASNGIADTLAASSTTTAPGATTVLATITATPPGTYDVEVTIALTGTAETALQNVRLRQNGVVISTLPTLTGLVVKQRFQRVTNTTGNIDVQAIAAGVAGAIYNVTLTATRTG